MDGARQARIIRTDKLFDFQSDDGFIRSLGAQLLSDNADVVLCILEIVHGRVLR